MKIYRFTLEGLHRLEEIKLLEDAGEITSDRARRARYDVWKEIGYDAYTGLVIVAESERRARSVAMSTSLEAGVSNERAERWLDKKKVRCELLGDAIEAFERIVLATYRYE